MCLTTKVNDFSIMQEDMIVYKVIHPIGDGRYRPHYERDFIYEKDKEQPTVNMRMTEAWRDGNTYEVENGYHSFSNLTDTELFIEWRKGNNPSICIGVFIIPKGAKFAKGQFCGYESIVSSTIIFKDVLKEENHVLTNEESEDQNS